MVTSFFQADQTSYYLRDCHRSFHNCLHHCLTTTCAACLQRSYCGEINSVTLNDWAMEILVVQDYKLAKSTTFKHYKYYAHTFSRNTCIYLLLKLISIQNKHACTVDVTSESMQCDCMRIITCMCMPHW